MLGSLDEPELDSDGLTKKQKDMSTARNPLSGNSQNSVQDDTKQTETTGVTTDAKKTNVRTAQAQTIQPLVKVQKTLGSFSTRLQAKANQFLSGATNNQATGVGQGGDVVFDQTALGGKGAWVAKDGSTRIDDSQVANDKLAQQQDLKQTASEFYNTDETGKVSGPKSFNETLKKFADTNGDGVIDDEEQHALDQSTEVATKLHELESLGQKDSAESRALRAELKMFDQGGLVSGLLTARTQYQTLFGGAKDKYGNTTQGLKYTGDKGDEEKSLTDLLNLSSDKIKEEVTKATKSASGLFGGSFEDNIDARIDRDASAYKDSQRERAGVLNQFVAAGTLFVNNYETKFKQQAAQFADSFRQGAAQFANDPTMSPDVKKWFANIANKPNSDVGQAMLDVLQGKSGLGANEQQIIAGYIGDLPGFDVDDKNLKLSGMLKDLSTKGTFVLPDKDGAPKEYKPKTEDLAMLTKILYDKNLSPEQRDAALLDAVDGSLEDATPLDDDFKKVQSYLSSGQLDKSIAVFGKNVASSLVTFDKSRTNELFDKVSKDNPRKDGETGEAYTARIGQLVLSLNTDLNKQVVSLGTEINKTIDSAMTRVADGENGLKSVVGAPVDDEATFNNAVDEWGNGTRNKLIDENLAKLTQDFANPPAKAGLINKFKEIENTNNVLVAKLFKGYEQFPGKLTQEQIALRVEPTLDKYIKRTIEIWGGGYGKPDKEIQNWKNSNPDKLKLITSLYKNKGISDFLIPRNDRFPTTAVAEAASGLLGVFDVVGKDFETSGPILKSVKNVLTQGEFSLLQKYISDPKSMKANVRQTKPGALAPLEVDFGQVEQLKNLSEKVTSFFSNPNNFRDAFKDSFNPISEVIATQVNNLKTIGQNLRATKAGLVDKRKTLSEMVASQKLDTFDQMAVVKAAKEFHSLNFGKQSDPNVMNKLAAENTQLATSANFGEPTTTEKLYATLRSGAAPSASGSLGSLKNKSSTQLFGG